MRLGQLSRKLEIKPSEIRSFIQDEFNITIENDLNAKIDDQFVNALESKFAKPVVISTQEKKAEKVVNVEIPEEKNSIESVEQTEIVNEVSPVIEPAIEVIPAVDIHETTEQVESNEKFEPLPVDPNAELIKAPKIKLDGPKVLGKIELPEIEKKVTPEKTEESETKSSRKKGQKYTEDEEDEAYSIFKDKNGIYHFSQTQRQNRINSLERIKLEKIEAKRKQKKAKHYREIVQSDKVNANSATKKVKKQSHKTNHESQKKMERKGLWGKFLNWLNG